MSDQFGMPLVDHRPSHEVIAELRDQLTAAQAREAELMAEIAELVATLESARAMIGHPDNIAIIDAALAKVRKP